MTAHTTPTQDQGEPAESDAQGAAGAVLQQMVDDLNDCAGALSADLEGPLAAMARSIVGELSEEVCRIAVIGQVKAGKSTFINALAARPTMLPTDVNPWTAVVTKIHFGEPGRQEGAYFEFFTEDEWRHMIGGGRVREMASNLAPNLDSDEIHKQLSQFEQRAKSRLGESFPQMLGKHHLFSSVTPGVLERYVTAGEDRPVAEGAIDESNAHFADITKSADLYFKDNPFGFPTVVIDTPGTNDPFLVRDEITLQNLETADVYVVVVTAQQPLSNTDLNLLRLLQGVDAGRTLIFLNRLDMLDGAAANYPAVLERVRAILRKEFSTDDIPVIPGSAAWGLRALTPMGAHRDGTLDDDFASYATARGFAVDDAMKQLPEAGDPDESLLANLLTDVSGLNEINAELARLMRGSRAAQKIASVAGIVAALTHNYALLSRYEAERIEMRAQQDEAQRREDRKQRRSAFETAARELADRFKAFERDYAALASEGTRKITDRLQTAVTHLAAAEQTALEDKLRAGERLDAPRLDTIGIRHKMAREFLAVYDEVAASMQAFERNHLKEIDEMFAEAAPGLTGAMTAGPLPAAPARPSLSPLAQAVAVDLDEPRRFVWQSQSDDPRQAVRALRTGLERDFLTVSRELSDLAKKALSTHAASVTRRYRTIVHETLEIVAKLLLVANTPDDLDAALAEARARAARMTALAQRAAALEQSCREALRAS